DGSYDQTEKIINQLKQNDDLVQALSFTRNFGKEAALMAGLNYATGEAIIPIDVDLQDPIELIRQRIEGWKNGAEFVWAKRTARLNETWLKRNTASIFYRLHNKISYPEIEENVGDFRLLSREIVQQILQLSEKNLFMKGVFSWIGGETVTLEYKREVRSAGHT